MFVWALDEVAVFQGDPSLWVNDWTIFFVLMNDDVLQLLWTFIVHLVDGRA